MISFLEFLAESKSPLLNAFEKVFDKDVIYSRDPFELTLLDIQKVYDIMNRSVFNNKLSLNDKSKNISLYCADERTIANILKNEFGVIDPDISNNLALYQPRMEFLRSITTGKLKIKSDRHGIFINLTQATNPPFGFILASLCHEMIHCLDVLEGDLLEFTAFMLQNGYSPAEISWQSHSSPMFRKKRAFMKNVNGISIPLSGDGKNMNDLYDQIVSEMNLMKEEDEDNPEDYQRYEFPLKFFERNKQIMRCRDGSILFRFS